MRVDRSGARAAEIFAQSLASVQAQTSRVFLWLFLLQWLAAIALAIIISPYAWAGQVRSLHFHVELALVGGAVLNALPIVLLLLRPTWWGTRHVVAATQMLWAAMFIHLTGGRIETHFHIFGSLAFLSFYRDWRVLVTATAVTAIHHLLFGLYEPLSVYGVGNPESWRFLEHASWVAFEDVVLFFGCQRQLSEMKRLSDREAGLEAAKQDVERQVAERTAELREAGDRYRSLIENTSAVPWELDSRSCAIIYLAPQMDELFDLAPGSSAPGRSLLDLLHPDDRLNFGEFIRGIGVLSGAESYLDSRIVTRAQRVRHIRSFVAKSKAAEKGRCCGIFVDVTQEKTLERDLLQAQKLESIGQLSAGIAHEINTPAQFIGDNIRFLQETVGDVLRAAERNGVSPVAGATAQSDVTTGAALQDFDYLKEEIPKAIQQSLDGVERISRIVSAMKEFSHPAIDLTPYDLNRAILSTITVTSNEWKYVAEVETDLDPQLPPVVVMPGAFNQVILNMLVNAAHAVGAVVAENPGSKGLIRISTCTALDSVEIRIQDSGCGIPEQFRHRIFDPFFTTKEVGKGTGQGLAIAHDVIVKKHHGAIEVESEPGAGSTFTIRLPLDPKGYSEMAA